MKTNVASRVVVVIGLVLLLVPLASAGNGPGGAPGRFQAAGPGPLTVPRHHRSHPWHTVTITIRTARAPVMLGNGRLLCYVHVVSGLFPGDPTN